MAVQGVCFVERVLGKCVVSKIKERCSHLMICGLTRYQGHGCDSHARVGRLPLLHDQHADPESWGLSIFYRDTTHFQVKPLQMHGPNVLKLQVA